MELKSIRACERGVQAEAGLWGDGSACGGKMKILRLTPRRLRQVSAMILQEGHVMRYRIALSLLLAFLLVGPGLYAESKNPSDYPLRVHIFRRNETTFYHNRQEEEAKGEGRANLFEGGEPKGVDFRFECSDKLQTSSGYETFPARWKKPNQELVVLLPEFGKPGHYSTCNFKVEVKNFAYFSRNGNLSTEPSSDFKKWMVLHEYDPEHGKDTPTQTQAGPAGAKPVTP